MYTKWITWIMLGLLVGYSFSRRHVSGPKLDIPAPTFKAKLNDNSDFDLENHKGKVIVLDFWATWCPPCRESLPALSKVAAKYKNDPKVWIGSVNKEDLSRPEMDRWLAQRKLKFPVIRDYQYTISRDYKVAALPTMVIINPKGEISHVEVGLVSSHVPTLVKHLSKLIEEARQK